MGLWGLEDDKVGRCCAWVFFIEILGMGLVGGS